MRAVMPTLLPDVLSYRKLRGQDKWDEMWDGVLHMPPMPNIEHQDFEGDLQAYLREYWGLPKGAKVWHQVNVASFGGWPHDRDTKEPEVHLLRGVRYRKQRPVAGGRVRSPATGIEFRRAAGAKLSVRIIGDDATRRELPED